VGGVLPDYVLGRTREEYARLALQARIIRPYTARFFRAAGLAPGMRVLDLGSGVGDVAMLAAELVGPEGHVHGIDLDATVLEHARSRASDHGFESCVTFEASAIDEYTPAERFDALVGRYVLLYLPDAAATIRRLLRSVNPGGVVVFHDVDFSESQPSYPPCPLWDEGCRLVREAFERAGTPLTFGRKLGDTFVRAGLPFPVICSEGVVGGGRGSLLYGWLATVIASLAPRLDHLGLPMPPALAPLQTLESRLEEEAVRLNGQVSITVQIGAWAHSTHFAVGESGRT